MVTMRQQHFSPQRTTSSVVNTLIKKSNAQQTSTMYTAGWMLKNNWKKFSYNNHFLRYFDNSTGWVLCLFYLLITASPLSCKKKMLSALETQHNATWDTCHIHNCTLMAFREPLNSMLWDETSVHTGLSWARMVLTFCRVWMSHTFTKYRAVRH